MENNNPEEYTVLTYWIDYDVEKAYLIVEYLNPKISDYNSGIYLIESDYKEK